MIKIHLSLCLVMASFYCNAQFNNERNTINQESFSAKKSPQKTIYLATAIPGVVLLSVGFVMFLSDYGEGLPGGSGADEKKMKTGETLMYVGGGLTLISIPFYIASRRNNGFHITMDVKNNKMLMVHKTNFIDRYYPSLSLKIDISKSSL